MNIRRTVPNIPSNQPEESHGFFKDFLGMDVAMEMDGIVIFASPSNPTSQISVIRKDQNGPPVPNISVEVEDVDAMHEKALSQNVEIVYPIRNEPWGVRRFFVKYGDDMIINILSHI